ncbi:MAG TPA: sigma-70 family RNA polymerase sigma factor, partial [Mycobacteriales bacterium]|nr:sigma-70 family RNA polymerase sigma factor [Mycobacteriales bacterium]
MSTDRAVEDLLRELAPQVLGVLARRHGQFDACEDAVQEALLDAALQWPEQGVPGNPRGWLLAVATRRLTDHWRADSARRRREVAVAALEPPPAAGSPDPERPEQDDTLTLLFLCCHPALSAPSQLALTLRAVGGLSTAQVARAFLVPEATMAQRISRAKASIRSAGATFATPPRAEWPDRLRVVRHVLYLIFNEGYATTAGPDLQRPELTAEAIRLARALHRLLPDDGETAGLLALMLLTDARRPARTDEHGDLVPMAEQDRTRWNADYIREGVDLLTAAVAHHNPGPYQIQAAIAALHDEAPTAEATDWPQIRALYDILLARTDNPVVALNHAVAVAMAEGVEAGRARLAELAADPRIAEHPRYLAVSAHLLEMAGDV